MNIFRILNDAFDECNIIDDKVYYIGYDSEGYGGQQCHNKLKEMHFILNAACPDKHIYIVTGAYLIDPITNNELYDNYNNRYFIIEKEFFLENAYSIIKKQIEILKEYHIDPKSDDIYRLANNIKMGLDLF